MLLKHTFLLTISALLVVVISLPNLLLLSTSKEGNLPLTTNTKLAYMAEETYIYAAHVQQILKGNLGGDVYLWEYSDSPSPFLGELASIFPVAVLSKIAGSVSNGFILSDLIFPFSMFFLIIFFLRKLDFKQSFSIAAALGVITVPFLSMLLPRISSHGTQLTGDAANAILFSRTPHPQISAIFLFGSLFLAAQVLKNPTPKLVYIWAIVLGLSLYSSPFTASTVFLATVLILPLLWTKISKKTLAQALAIVGIASLPFAINMLQLQNLLTNSDFLLRTTFPVNFLFPRQLRFILIALILFKLRKDSLSWVILSYVIAASVLSDGHQIVTGRNVEADHYLSRVLAPISTLAVFLIINKFTQNFNQRRINFLWLGTVVVLIVIAFTKQFTWTNMHIGDLKPDYNLQALIKTIELETQKDEVIGSLDPQIEMYVTGLTGRSVYLAPGDRTIANSDEQLQRICDLVLLSKENEERKVTRNLLNYALGFNIWFRDDISDINAKVEECISKPPQVPKYKLDFLIEKSNSEDWQLIPLAKR